MRYTTKRKLSMPCDQRSYPVPIRPVPAPPGTLRHTSPQVYDDLNWGFVWMGGSTRSVRLLNCLLDAWNHSSFTGATSAFVNFHRRSQPRVNHLLEEHFEQSARNEMRLHVCKVLL